MCDLMWMQSACLDADDIPAAASSPSESPVRESRLTRSSVLLDRMDLQPMKPLEARQDAQPAKRGKPRVALTAFFGTFLSLGNLVLAASVCTGNQRVSALL